MIRHILALIVWLVLSPLVPAAADADTSPGEDVGSTPSDTNPPETGDPSGDWKLPDGTTITLKTTYPPTKPDIVEITVRYDGGPPTPTVNGRRGPNRTISSSGTIALRGSPSPGDVRWRGNKGYFLAPGTSRWRPISKVPDKQSEGPKPVWP